MSIQIKTSQGLVPVATTPEQISYTLSKINNEILLTSSTGTVNRVLDKDTTYTFTENEGVLTIAGSDGTSASFNLGGEITSAAIIAALGYTPADEDDVPTALSSLTDDETHRLVTDTEKSTWNAKGNYSKPTDGIPKTDLAQAVQTSLEKADTAIQDISGKVDKETGKSLISDTEITRLASVDNYDDTALSGRVNTLENAGYITNAVNNLTNYYLKTETYTQDEVDNLVSEIPKFSIEVVSSLPTENISTTTVYLLSASEEEGDLYTEYIYVNNKWEKLGTQRTDLTGYVKDTTTINGHALSSNITLDASDVGALPDTTVIPDAVTESTVSGWGFTKNTGTYTKPTDGIPKADLSNDVQTSLTKADSSVAISYSSTEPTQSAGDIWWLEY